jgi:hypothetical protein
LNIRKHLLDLLEEKKMRETKLAYKVTECYPPECEKNEEGRPAGVAYPKQDQVYDLIYGRG